MMIPTLIWALFFKGIIALSEATYLKTCEYDMSN